LTPRLTVKKAALSFVDDADFIDKKDVTDVALKVASGYRERVRAGTAEADELIDDPALLIQRVQNELVFQVHEKIKDSYGGERGRWLPSDADEPRPEHQLNYGKEYVIGEGIDGVEPGDEPGCRCGVEILVPETKLFEGE
jgi:hypothetical protein